jgi:hypothetical protein
MPQQLAGFVYGTETAEKQTTINNIQVVCVAICISSCSKQQPL